MAYYCCVFILSLLLIDNNSVLIKTITTTVQVHCQPHVNITTSGHSLVSNCMSSPIVTQRINKEHLPVIFFCTIRLEAAPSLLLLPSITTLRSPWLLLATPPTLTSRSLSMSEWHMDVDGEDCRDELAEDSVEEVDEGDNGAPTTVIVRMWAALLSVITGPGPLLNRSSNGGTRSHTYLASGDRIGWSALKSKPHRLVASRTCFLSCVSTMLRGSGDD